LRLCLTLAVLALGLLLGCGVHAEEGVWLGSFNQVALGEGSTGLRLWLDLHDRRGSTGTVHIVRPALGWALGKHTTLWAGYAWVPTVFDEADTTHEHRLWQQAIVTGSPVEGLSLSFRPRLEERFLADEDLALRLRLFGRAGLNVGEGWGLVVWDELFVQLNEPGWTAPQGLDQNRLFLGPMIQPTPSVRVEVGYLNQWVPRPDATVMNHIGTMNLFLSF
jgi:hypothetical protein